MATSALPTQDVEQPVGGGSWDAGFGVIQGKGRGKRNPIGVEPRYEVIDGVIYMMAAPKFWHQWAVFKMAFQIEQQLAPHDCVVFIAPFDVYLFWDKGNQKDCVEPDLFIACDQEQLKRFKASEQDYYHGAPKFVVEILSPSTGAHDLVRKAELYYRAGVAEYWVVDPLARTIHVFTLLEHGTEYDIKILGAKGSIPLITFPGVTVDFNAIFPEEQDAVQSD
ncbi:MAG: Uma2 family endonuclease [Treponema sp.]|jgi:Uma2 family endonuclease|nr:Uma2 family endonuclease [Treponema sp.]